MFIDELRVHARAGKGGDGVRRWRHEYARPLAGPAGGNGGRGGNVLIRAVRNNAALLRYKGVTEIVAENGGDGAGVSKFGKNGEDYVIEVPVGSYVRNEDIGIAYELLTPGEEIVILRGGNGGFGNEHFKSSTNRSPEEHTEGKKGEEATFFIEVRLVVDVGIIGEPNAGKSTLLNMLTNARSKVAPYAFTTLSPHLGDCYGFTLADIPGLIEGASMGKGLGHVFLRHIERTHMLIHCVSLEQENPYEAYLRVRSELEKYNLAIVQKREWVVLTKADTRTKEEVETVRHEFIERGHAVYVISQEDGASVKQLQDALVLTLREGDNSATMGG